MTKYKRWIKDFFFTVFILLTSYFLSFCIQFGFETNTMTPSIFILGVFFTSLKTNGYFWGIFASLVSVILVNFTFTLPHFKIDLMNPVNLVAAIVMLLVAIMASALTTQMKQQEKIKAEKHLGYFALYAFFFPQILSGPPDSSQPYSKRICGRYFNCLLERKLCL